MRLAARVLTDPEKLRTVWRQTEIPVVWREDREKMPLLFRWQPYSVEMQRWLKVQLKREPGWEPDGSYWKLPKNAFNELVNRSLKRFGRLYVIQPFREQEKCSPSCKNAVGHICECSCMGAYHGVENDGSWFEVSERFATRWKERELACRLMAAKAPTNGSRNTD